MTIDTDPLSPSLNAATEADAVAALAANTAGSRQTNLKRVAEMSESIGVNHVAAHIRGVVALTMARISAGAPATTREQADAWRAWASDAADGIEKSTLAGQ